MPPTPSRSPAADPARPRLPSGRAVSADGVGVAYYDLGGQGPPLVIVHPTGFCGPVLGPMAAHLRPFFHAVAVDERGHGGSDLPPRGDFDWEGFGADVLAVVDHLGLERPYGFGHSSGAAALLLAEEERPGTFAALYCFEPVVYPGDEPLRPSMEGNPLVETALRRREEFPSREEALANFAGKAPFDRLHPDALAAYVDNGFAPRPGGGIGLRCRRDHEAQVYAHAFSHDAFARLGDVHCPVTLACGEETDAFGPELLARFAERLQHPRTLVIPGVGHFGPLEDPAAVAASVAASMVPGSDTPRA